MSLRKKAMRDDALFEFINPLLLKSKRVLIYKEFPSDVCDNPVWYLPYFVTCQVKKRIVYDNIAKFDGVCRNDYFSTSPNVLNHLSDILAGFRLGKFAFMPDITKCFFQSQSFLESA